MLNIIIKHFFIYICCIYIYRHLQNNHTRNNFEIPISIVFSFSLALFTAIVKDFFPTFVNILPIIILWIMHSAISAQPKVSFVTTMIAFAISYGFYILSCFTLAIILSIFHFDDPRKVPLYSLFICRYYRTVSFSFSIPPKTLSQRNAIPFCHKTFKYWNDCLSILPSSINIFTNI